MGANSPLFWQYCQSAMHTMLSAVEFSFLLSTSLAFLLANGTASAISRAKDVSRHLKRTGLAFSGLLKKPGLMNLRSLSQFLRIAAFEGSKVKLTPIVAAVQHHELCGVLWLAACFVASALLWVSVCSASTAVMVLCEGFGGLVRRLRYNISAPSRYPFQPSDSGLLRLPPEIRFMIWQVLLGNRDTIYVTTYDGYLKLQACETVFLETFGQENTGNCGLTLDRTFFRTCRQLYNELDHFLYATKTFFIADPEVLISFINGLNPVQRHCLGQLHLFVETEWTDFGDVEDFADYENWEDFEKLNERSQSSLTQSSLAIRWAIEALPSLQTVDLWIQDMDPAGNEYLAQGGFQILNNMQVSKSVTVTLLVDEPISGGLKALSWSHGYRKAFADAVWAHIRYPGCSTLELTGLENGGQAKYVLDFFGKKPGARVGFGFR